MPQGEDELAKRLVMLDEVAPTDPWLSEAVGPAAHEQADQTRHHSTARFPKAGGTACSQQDSAWRNDCGYPHISQRTSWMFLNFAEPRIWSVASPSQPLAPRSTCRDKAPNCLDSVSGNSAKDETSDYSARCDKRISPVSADCASGRNRAQKSRMSTSNVTPREMIFWGKPQDSTCACDERVVLAARLGPTAFPGPKLMPTHVRKIKAQSH